MSSLLGCPRRMKMRTQVGNLSGDLDSTDYVIFSDDICPFCDQSIPSCIKEQFDHQLLSVLPYTVKGPRMANPNGRYPKPKKLSHVVNFCTWHREEAKGDALEALGTNWPTSISGQSLHKRMLQHVPLLQHLALNPSTGFAFAPIQAMWAQKGRKDCLTPKGMYDASNVWGTS